jgi:hypothetical protein
MTAITVQEAAQKVATKEWGKTEFYQWIDSLPPKKITVFNPTKPKK